MSKRLQFRNLSLEQTLYELEEYTRQPTVIQPAITLPIKSEVLVPLPPVWSPASRRDTSGPDTRVYDRSMGAQPALLEASTETGAEGLEILGAPTPESSRKKKLLRGAALALSALLALAIYFTWRSVTPSAASPTVSQQSYSGVSNPQIVSSASPTATALATSSNGTIQVYIVGAIKRPGVYTLPAGARVYQLVQAAGGTLPSADLVALNLAAQLTDGEEIYVLSVGEVPPNNPNNPPGSGGDGTPTVTPGQLVNINTATEAEMRQALHVSAATAQKIIAYRTQHGPYTSVDQLLQVISKTIYDRIKNMVTV